MATIKYLRVVGDIEAQADQAGLELFRAQSARVVLVCGGGATGHAATHTAQSVMARGKRGRVVGCRVGGWEEVVHHAREKGMGGRKRKVRVKGEDHA